MATIVSLCDYSGNWPRPYHEEGHTVILVDPKHPDPNESLIPSDDGFIRVGMTAQRMRDWLMELHDENAPNGYGMDCADCPYPLPLQDVAGLLMAPPCYDFAVSGARWWAAKDADGRTRSSMEIVFACLDIVDLLSPGFWALENPVGRIPSLFPELGAARMFFQPCDYGDPYTKKTGLWGDFCTSLTQNPVDPVMYTDSKGNRGSWMWAKLGGKSARTKELRSNTPLGFARAFAAANPV